RPRSGRRAALEDAVKSLIMALALLMSVAAAAHAQGGPPPGPPPPPHGPNPGEIDELSDELGLKPAQKQGIRDIADEARKKQAKLRADLEVVEIDLRRELERDEPDEKKVIGYIDQLSALEGEMRKVNVVAWLKIRKLLTKEQRAKLDEHH